jgi:hypothetical protein
LPRDALLRAAVAGHCWRWVVASAASKRRRPAEAASREDGAKMPLVFPIRQGAIQCRERLGGLLKYYECDAA